MADTSPAATPRTTSAETIAILFMHWSPSMLVIRVRRLRRRLRLIARRGCPREHLMDRRGPGPHVHSAVSAEGEPGVLVKVGVQVVGAVAAMQIDRQDLEDRRALRV